MLYDDINVIDKQVKVHLAELLSEKCGRAKDDNFIFVDTFLSFPGHPTFDEFFAFLDSKNVKFSKEETQDRLKVLLEFGFAAVIHFEGEKIKRFEPLAPNNHHDHFYCLKCKKIIEFGNRQLENIQDSLIFNRGCRPLFHKLEVYGLCDKCNSEDVSAVQLSYVKEGARVMLHKIRGEKGFRKRLIELGFRENQELIVIKNSNFGPIVVEVKQSRIALGRNEARKILVKT